jgi:hypothetical protein
MDIHKASSSNVCHTSTHDYDLDLDLDMDDDNYMEDEQVPSTRRLTSTPEDKQKKGQTSYKPQVKKGVMCKSFVSSKVKSAKGDIKDGEKKMNVSDINAGKKKNDPAANCSKTKTVSHSVDKAKSYPVKLDEEITISSEGEVGKQNDDAHVDWHRYQRPCKKKPTKDNQLVQVLQERSQIMHKMTDTVATISKAAMKEQPQDSAEMLWAKSLVLQMSRMKESVKDQFMVHVYKLAMDAISGKFPST